MSKGRKMKHHEYQIYFGGFKILLKNTYYCKECNKLVYTYNQNPLKYTNTHKKQSNNVPYPKRKGHSPIALRKHV